MSEADKRNPTLPPDPYHGNVAAAQLKVGLKGLMNGATTPAWSSLPADQLMYGEVDMELLEHLRLNGLDLGSCRLAQLNSCLIRSGKICLRPRHTDTYYMAMLDVGSMVVGHPLVQHTMWKSRRQSYRPSLDDADRKLHPLFIINPYKFDSFVMDVESPCESAHHEGVTSPDLAHGEIGLRIFPKCNPDNLLVSCAREAFFGLPLPTLRALGREYCPDMIASSTRYQTLKFMLMSILKVNEKAVLEFLHKEIVQSMVYMEAFLAIEGSDGLFPDEEVKEMEAADEKRKEKDAIAREYIREY